jgi:hypothetical protein
MLQVFRQYEYSDASEMCSLLSSDDSDLTWMCHIRITVIHIFSIVTIVINELLMNSVSSVINDNLFIKLDGWGLVPNWY